MPPNDPIADDLIADWLSPRQAVEILDAAYPPASRVSRQVLLERLRGGMVQAVTAYSVFEGRRQPREVFYKIPSEDWKKVDTADILWITGDLTYSRREYGSGDLKTVRHYNVRFEPQDVHAILRGVSKTTKPDAPAATDDEPVQKGPRVSNTYLQAWFEFYKKVHSGAEDTEDRALEFARQCFPGKSVSRDRVRALRGSIKRGPKTKLT